MRKGFLINEEMRKYLTIYEETVYDYATAPFRISLYMRKFCFSFLSVYTFSFLYSVLHPSSYHYYAFPHPSFLSYLLPHIAISSLSYTLISSVLIKPLCFYFVSSVLLFLPDSYNPVLSALLSSCSTLSAPNLMCYLSASMF